MGVGGTGAGTGAAMGAGVEGNSVGTGVFGVRVLVGGVLGTAV